MDLTTKEIYSSKKSIKTTNGLIFLDDFTDSTLWTADAEWTQVNEPTMVVFNRSPYLALKGGQYAEETYSYNAGVPNDTDISGTRESSILIDDDGTWYMYYDGGNGTTSWRGQCAKSTDRGRSWKKYGDMGLGFNKYTSVGTTPSGVHPATSNCLVVKEGATYYFFRFVAGSVFGDNVPGSPYSTEVFTSNSPTEGWVWRGVVSVVGSDVTGSNNKDSNVTSIIYYNGKYHAYSSDVRASNQEYNIGRYTADYLEGPWTRINGTLLPSAINGKPENPRVFFNTTINKWVLNVNQVSDDGTKTDKNSIYTSDNPLDWSNAIRHDVQFISISDGLRAIGLPATMLRKNLETEITKGYVPFTYDAEPLPAGNHNSRKLFYSTLEPSIAAFKCSGSSFPSFKKAVRTVSHSDFIAEFTIKHNGTNEGGLFFRTQSNGDGYRITSKPGSFLKLEKYTSGVFTTLSSGGGKYQCKGGYFVNRIKISCVGNVIKAYLNGEFQINYTDNSSPYTNGVSVALVANSSVDIRRLHFRNNNNIIINNLTDKDVVVIRGVGGYVLAEKQANGSSLTFGESDSITHYPVGEIELNGVVIHRDLIWGGDIYNVVNHPVSLASPFIQVPYNNLIAFYPLQNSANDSRGLNNGTATSITHSIGKSGNAAVFNGSTSKIIINNNALFQLYQGSISFLVNATASGSSFRALVTKGNAYGVFLNDGVLIVYSWDNPSGIKTTNINLNIGDWNHLVMTFDSGITNGTKIYLNGYLVLTTTTKVLSHDISLQIGSNEPSVEQRVNALIQGVGIWNVILTQSQVIEIFKKQNSVLELI